MSKKRGKVTRILDSGHMIVTSEDGQTHFLNKRVWYDTFRGLRMTVKPSVGNPVEFLTAGEHPVTPDFLIGPGKQYRHRDDIAEMFVDDMFWQSRIGD